jgi:hypothetical protein
MSDPRGYFLPAVARGRYYTRSMAKTQTSSSTAFTYAAGTCRLSMRRR